jgi:hypothetical protein
MLCLSTCLVLPIKAPNMSTAEDETYHHSIDHDVEIRVRNFRIFTIAALRNFTILIILVGIFWVYIEAIPSTIPMPFPVRWICIVCLYLDTIARNAWLIRIIDAIARIHMSKIEDENRSRNRDLGTRTTDLEDWILANFCAIASLSTIGFVAWYWMKVITLTGRSVFYWTFTMAGLCLLFWLFKRTIHFYRKAKGLKHEEVWGFLIGVNVLQLYNKFEQLKADGALGQFLDAGRLFSEVPKFLLYVVGFHIGRGPLFGEFVAKVPQDYGLTRRRPLTR